MPHDHFGHTHDHHQHDHGSDHSHDHHDHAAHASRTRLAWAGGLTLVFMLAEIIGGLISGSLALLADAAHMLTDSASLFVAWFGFRLAERPADDKRSFGFGRFRILAAFANGITLVLLAIWIVAEAIHRLLTPNVIESDVLLGVAIAGLIVNIIAFAILHGGDKHHHDVNLQGALWHVAGDMLGSVAAIIAAIVIMYSGWAAIDPILSALVAAIIGFGGIRVVRRSAHILLQGAPERFDTDHVVRDLENTVPGVVDVHHVHAWTMTGEDRLMTLHIQLATDANPEVARRAVRERLKSKHHVAHATIEIDSPTDDDIACCDCLPNIKETAH